MVNAAALVNVEKGHADPPRSKTRRGGRTSREEAV